MPHNSSSPSNTYDDVPYEGGAYSSSHPRRLAVNARLFGMTPVDPDQARVLEIGCASGGNLIPIAMLAPNSSCVGIDLSARQVEQGTAEIVALGLSNIRLDQKSVADITPAFGRFDYIICHGVFSWVPADIQSHILRVCKENLTENGVAYISYNTRPGWNAVQSLRDMMLYHTAQFTDPAQRIEEAVRVLQFALQAQGEQQNPLRQAIEAELRILDGAKGWYLYHDHLEAQNSPVYFHEFVAMAAQAGLAYVGDTSLPSMFVGTLPDSAARTLSQITDIIRQEQYMDFLKDRRFRSTILAHAEASINRTIAKEAILDFHVTAAVTPDFPVATQNWAADGKRSFNDGTLSTESAATALMLCILGENRGRPIAASDLVTEAARRRGRGDEAAVRQALVDFGVEMALRGVIVLHDRGYADIALISERPMVFPLARRQAESSHVVTNCRHAPVGLELHVMEAATILDGTLTLEEAVEPFLERFRAKGHIINENNVPVTDPERERALVLELLRNASTVFRDHGLLVA